MENKKVFLYITFTVLIIVVISICVRLVFLKNYENTSTSIVNPARVSSETENFNTPSVIEKPSSQDNINLENKSGQNASKQKITKDKDSTMISKKQLPFFLSNARPITPKGDYINPRWSPDGLDVLFTRAKYKGLYLVSAQGSEIRQLSDEEGIGYKVKWSKDGTKLITEKEGEKKIIDISGDESTEQGEEDVDSELVFSRDDNIYYQDPQSGEIRQITNDEDKFYNPQLSPDGAKVAYEGLTSGIYIKDLKTGEIIHIGAGSQPQWLPDGSGIIYGFTQDDGLRLIAGDIYFAYADGSGIFNLTNTPDVIEHKPSISPDGRMLTYEVDGQIFVVEIRPAY
ncbi:MAG: hypothetical protein N2246_04355 [Candidatus Sumerlaeia bacterium]|nr:hypothetical protein [Candidatus Sumerlaeia bacterium]